MRKGLLATAGALALGGSAAFGQAPPSPALPAEAPAAACGNLDLCPLPACEDDPAAGWGRVTLSAEYLLWWVRKGPTPGPLLTLGSTADDPFEGALGQPHTVALFGANGLDYHTFSGLRLGGSVGLTDTFALDGGYFVLERRSTGVSAASGPNGTPIPARPFFNENAQLPEAYTSSFPDFFTGQSAVVSHMRLQGFDVNLSANLARSRENTLDVLVGYRFLNLQEDLLFNDALTPLVPDSLTFLGPDNFVGPPSTLADFDSFRTRNHFNGGQVGARWLRAFGRLDLGLTGKVALGATDQRVQINGATSVLTPGAAPTTAPGGILAQQSNIGSYSRSTFSVVPEAGVSLGWHITDNLSATVGYTFLYWTDVARPGAQIDPRVNPFSVPSDKFGQGPAGGRPAFVFHESDFWAQGLTFGVTLRF